MYKSSLLRITNDISYIEHVVTYVRSVALKFGLNTKECNHLCYALEETLENNILYNFEEGSEDEICIYVEYEPNGIKVTIKDKGIPLDPFIHIPQNIQELEEESTLEFIDKFNPDKMSAVSTFIISKFLDKCKHINLGKEGKSVELVKYASGSHVGNVCKQITLSVDSKFEKVVEPQGDDFCGISRLFYKSYGYSYVNEDVYYPQKLEALVKLKGLISLIAKTNKNEVVGTISLMQPNKNYPIIEWGMAISDPAFRSQGIMSSLIDKIMLKANSTTFDGLFAHSVTNHTFTQKICAAHKFSDIALLLGYTDASLSFKKIHTTLTQRESTIISYKYLSKLDTVSLYLPKKHSEMIKFLYAGLGIEIEELNFTDNNAEQVTSFTNSTKSALNISEIYLAAAGDDALQYIKNVTKQNSIHKVDVNYLFLNLEDMDSIQLVEEFEKLGYFFAGIFPHYYHKHSLVLQYINNIKLDYEQITSASKEAKKLKEYIKAQDINQ